jgi:hypothetical protein
METIVQTVEWHKTCGRIRALDGLTLEVHRGDLYALHGDAWYIASIAWCIASIRSRPVHQSPATLTDTIVAVLPAGSAAWSRVMGRLYRFLAPSLPVLLDRWERERNTGSSEVLTRRAGHDHHR